MRLHHVQLAIPAGEEEAARAFYGDALGLTEITKPPELAKRGGVWFAVGDHELHLGVEQDFRAARKAHPGFQVEHVDSLAARLETAGHTVVWDRDTIPGRNRFHCHDPFGNRLEFLDHRE